MKYVWLVINLETNRVEALYNTASIAEKMAPVIAEKFDIDVMVKKRTINLELSQLRTRP